LINHSSGNETMAAARQHTLSAGAHFRAFSTASSVSTVLGFGIPCDRSSSPRPSPGRSKLKLRTNGANRATHLSDRQPATDKRARDLSGERVSAFPLYIPSLLFPGTAFDSSPRLLSPSQARAPRSDRAPGSSPRFLDHFPATPSVPLALAFALEKRVSRNIRNIRARAHPVDYFESIITKRSGRRAAGRRSRPREEEHGAATERERRGKQTKKRSKGTRLGRGVGRGEAESRSASRRSQERRFARFHRSAFRRLRFRVACFARRRSASHEFVVQPVKIDQRH